MQQDLKRPYDQASRLSMDALIRSLAVNQGRPVCLLLGAGTSITSGMPSAERCIWEWKKEIFVTNNPTLRQHVGELSLPGIRRRIQTWLDRRGNYPVEGDPCEYSFYAEACYPTGDDRRAFFQQYVTKAKPHVGYQIVPLLARATLVRSVWTTNFDGLVARASAAANLVCVEVSCDSTARAVRPQSQNELRVVSLHGDYRYDRLKNTKAELQTQEIALRQEFLHELKDYDLIVLGYSGRDDSLMSSLHEAYGQSNPCRLFWCGYGDDCPGGVEQLINSARKAGCNAFYIPTQGFDDFMARVALRQLDGDLLLESKKLFETIADPFGPPSVFQASSLTPTSLIKSNAYPLKYPATALKVDIKIPQNTSVGKWLDEKFSPTLGSMVRLGGGAIAFAESAQLVSAFGGLLQSNPLPMAISAEDVEKDGGIRSLLRRGLVLSIAKHTSAQTDGSRRVWESHHTKDQSVAGVKYRLHRALSVRVEILQGQLHAVLMPEYVVTDTSGAPVDLEITKVVRSAVYGFQHNNVFDADLMHWVKQFSNQNTKMPLDMQAPGGGFFSLGRAPVYAGLYEKACPSLPDGIRKFASQQGFVVVDPNLIFSSADGKSEVGNPSPLKGLVQSKPWDYKITTSGLCNEIQLTVVCPAVDTPKLKTVLDYFTHPSKAQDNERDYLQDYPGFSPAFGIPLRYPEVGAATWVTLDDSVPGSPLEGAKALAVRICGALDMLRAIHPGSVTYIFVPERWKQYENINTENEHLDLHHVVKAYAARHGHSTQFIRERTTATNQKCRVQWWLSLALYAKALRTPWRLDCLDDETAFVGIGYSLDTAAPRGNHVLLGCSHLYSARGEGLQFRLGRIENPIIRGRNPYMSLDDARRTGETIRQLFYDAKMKLPTRVVLHKRTAFTDDEQRGLHQGLEGVENVELIEVTIEESLRYVASKLVNQQAQIDGYPVPRGAVVLLDKYSALLWVHGVTPSASNPKFRYYQGKRRIPTPLVIRRYRGQSDIVQVATEILGLSKMNWNTFDYYSRLPATLDSASAIAKVGNYLVGHGSAPYDYRLLI